ncbi:MAG: hypothetical protein RMJ43_07855 [Chloroherpetonaceae bacterium]|nr:hypothetical protein [Chthonomonadaceae bacterium]MDW8207737.1 hypothetical protein [Chloroherpetonaceae bacterium]
MLRWSSMPSRHMAAVLALCYVWLSAAGGFLHSCARFHTPSGVTCVATSAPSCATQEQTYVVAAEHRNADDACAVCVWQANNLSEALPALEILTPAILRQCVVTTLPRYLQSAPLASSSRAPPSV